MRANPAEHRPWAAAFCFAFLQFFYSPFAIYPYFVERAGNDKYLLL
jgi:hypothetical protein